MSVRINVNQKICTPYHFSFHRYIFHKSYWSSSKQWGAKVHSLNLLYNHQPYFDSFIAIENSFASNFDLRQMIDIKTVNSIIICLIISISNSWLLVLLAYRHFTVKIFLFLKSMRSLLKTWVSTHFSNCISNWPSVMTFNLLYLL